MKKPSFFICSDYTIRKEKRKETQLNKHPETGDYFEVRRVPLPSQIQEFLKIANEASRKVLFVGNSLMKVLKDEAQKDEQNDYLDLLYDIIFNATRELFHKAQDTEPKDIPNGIFLWIDKTNTVVHMQQN